MSTTSNAAAATNANSRPWFLHHANAKVALIFALLGIAFAVGLGSTDWYVVEGSSVAGSSGPSFRTIYFGLRLGSFCNGPQAAISYGANIATQGTNGGVQACIPYTYRAQLLEFQYLHDNAPAGADTSSLSDGITAYQHLIGASGIILALLALGVIVAAHQFFVNVSAAHGVYAPGVIPARVSLVILIIIEALVLIFWITIFPYKYFYDQEPSFFTGLTTYDTYHTLGLGFSIQIAGLLVGLYSLFQFPKDVVVLSANSV